MLKSNHLSRNTPFVYVRYCLLALALIGSFAAKEKLSSAAPFQKSPDAPAIASLLESTKFIRSLTEQQAIELVPRQSGLHYVDCPHCDRGRQENQLQWFPERPNHIECRYCAHRFPSPLYPDHEKLEVNTPLGNKAWYPYWTDQSGYRHFFQAKRDDLIRNYLAQQTRDLAQLYTLNRDEHAARRSAILLFRFAEVFPDWCFHYDYPFRQKEIFEGVVKPSQFRAGYRTARWTWWAYSDVPIPLVQAYEQLLDSNAFRQLSKERGVDVSQKIENDLIRNACDQVMANDDQLTNMSPTAWRGLITAGKAIREPTYIHEPVRRLKNLVEKQFFYDGVWCEGSPDYARQSVGGLEQVLDQLRNYSDPKGYVDPIDGANFQNLDLGNDLKLLKLAKESLSKLRLPNGRLVPVHDTWSTSRRDTIDRTRPFLLPALGHACLGGGTRNQQSQFHMTWSGGYGHSHGDNLSLLLFANGREQLSDIGYTHTAYRSWTLATASHNTVVIDGINQELGNRENPTDGSLLLFDIASDRIQVARASGERAYPGLATQYERTVLAVKIDNNRYYAVDLFEVAGGKQHDYWLHGDADQETRVDREGLWNPLETLLPDRIPWTPTRNEGEAGRIKVPYYAYGFVRNLESKSVHAFQQNHWTVVANDSEKEKRSALKVTLLSNRDGDLILGTNPSIRRAEEDDSRLESFHRPCLLWRQGSNGERTKNRFLSVIEPYLESPAILSIEEISRPGALAVLKVRLKDRIDWFILNASEKVDLQLGSGAFCFQGSIGMLSTSVTTGEKDNYFFAANGSWNDGNSEGTSSRVEGKLAEFASGHFSVTMPSEFQSIQAPSPGTVIRCVTNDGWVYPFTVKRCSQSANQLRIEPLEAIAMDWDDSTQHFQLRSFPQRKHFGPVTVDWFSPKANEPTR